MHNIQHLWNERARIFGDSTKSVMEQSFPDVVNTYIHNLHMKELLAAMPTGAKRILDIGCGWGRIAEDLVSRRHVKISGIDVSQHFVKLYNRRMKGKGKAVVGDMRMLPFKNATFGFVYCIVSLMYIFSFRDQKRAVLEMLRVLKKDGTLVLIEPNMIGVQLVRLGGLVSFLYRTVMRRQKVETYGGAFYIHDMIKLIDACGGSITQKRGYPFLTIFLLPTIFIGKVFPSVTNIILTMASAFDRLLPVAGLSYFSTWIIKKDNYL